MYIVVVEDERGALVSEHSLADGALTIGRTPDNEIVLPSGTISRQHARLSLDGFTAHLEDLGSANGVLVDDQRVRGSTTVSESSQIRIGEYRVFLERATGKMKASQSGINTAIVTPDQAHGKLVITNGPQAGREQLLFDPIVCVGRTDENDIIVPDVSVSRHHARLKRQDDGSYILTDLDSSNGTLAGGRAVKPSSRVYHGDRVQFGNVECVLVDPQGRGRARGMDRQRLVFALAVLAAAILGAVVSLLLQ